MERPIFIDLGDRTVESDQLTGSDKVSLEVKILWDGLFQGAGEAFVDLKEHPLQAATQLAGTALFSCALIGLAYRSRTAANIAGKGMMAAMSMEALNRLGRAGAAGFDTWCHPQHWRQNQEIVAQSLGHGVVDYALMGLGGTFGYAWGESRFGVLDVQERLQTAYEKQPADIPKLESSAFWHRPMPGFQANDDSLAASIFRSSRDAVVRLEGDDSSGSGFVVNGKEGLVVTNWHVARGNSAIAMHTTDDQIFSMRLLGRDRFSDLALLKTERLPARPLPAVELAPSSQGMKPGHRVFNIGHPAGLESEILSVGQFTKFELQEPLNEEATASVHPSAGMVYNVRTLGGSSGSPVFNESGQVVSVVSTGTSDDSAGPAVEHVHALLDQVLAHNPEHGFVSVHSQAKTVGTEELSLPVSLDIHSKILDRVALAERMSPLWKRQDIPIGEELLGRIPTIKLAGTSTLAADLYNFTHPRSKASEKIDEADVSP